MNLYLYSTDKYIQYFIIKYGKKKYEKGYICNIYTCVCVCERERERESHFAVYQKVMQCNVDYTSINK